MEVLTIVPFGGGTASVAGSNTEIQYNDNGSLGASADLTWDDTGKELGVGGDINLDDGGTYETTVQVVTPTANRTISFPDATGTVALVAGSTGQVTYNNAGAQAGLTSASIGSTDEINISLAGAASTPPVSFTGPWFTGGTATTTKPQLLIEPTGTTSTAWSTDGTGLGVNAASGFAGRLLDLQVNGTSNFSVNSTGSVSVPLGSNTAPSVYFGTDTDTGVYSLGANQVAISTNGTGRLFVDANGRVNVGQQSGGGYGVNGVSLFVKQYSDLIPQGLVVESSTDGSSIAIGHTGSVAGISAYYGSSGSYGPLAFFTSNTERLRITSDGKLGLGTSSPLGTVSIGNYANVSGQVSTVYIAGDKVNSNGAFGTLFFRNSDQSGGSTASIRGERESTNFATALTFYTQPTGSPGDGIERLRIDNQGNVGIGTTSPGTALDVNGAVKANYNVATGSLAAFVNSGGGLYSYHLGSGAGVINAVSDNSGTAGTLIFNTGSERARIDSSGRLLVGTSTARSNIEFGGGYAAAPPVQIETAVASRATGLSVINNNSGGYGGLIRIGSSAGSTIGSNGLVGDGVFYGMLSFVANDGTDFVEGARISAVVDGTSAANDLPTRLVFSTSSDGASSPTERMRIDSSGRVGIGTTTVNRQLVLYNNGLACLALQNSTTGNGSNDGFQFQLSESNGYIWNYESASTIFGTANTERARIDSSGRLLVGTSSGTTQVAAKFQARAGTAAAQGTIMLSRGTANPTSAQTIGEILFTDSNEGQGAKINAVPDANWATNDYPTRLGFFTTADGASGPTERMRITSDGKVGIGTTAPQSIFVVRGNTPRITLEPTDDTQNTRIQFALADGTVKSRITGGGSDGDAIRFSQGSSERMRVDSGGNIGIGTTSPSSTLDVNGSLSKNSGSFKIDHPLPELNETHHLVHSFVEAPDASNLYAGMVQLTDGVAEVNIDTAHRMTQGTFEALNTPQSWSSSNESGYAPVKSSLSGNLLTIECQDQTSEDTVYYEVRGIRKDNHMIETEWTDDNGRVITEPLKQSQAQENL